MKREVKKIGVLLGVIGLCVSFIGCGKSQQQTESATDVQKEQIEVESGNETAKEPEEIEKTDSKEETTNDNTSEVVQDGVLIPELSIEAKSIPENEALQFVKDMKIGINLGNTFDATNDNGYAGDDISLESAWVGVKTTKEMIDAVKAAGFETIRIPVSWHNHVDADFKINEAWLSRVQEVVDYAVANDMYIILNIHHDIDPEFYYPNSENYETSKKYITTIWTQLAKRFADYSEKLIFESINEPRLKGTDSEWWLDMSKDTSKDAVDCINRLNQEFVSLIRTTGGNNETRYLMVPGYAASSNFELIQEFQLPVDTSSAENRIILSLHAYTPYNFALQGPNESGSVSDFNVNNKASTKDINSFMDQIYKKYTSQGIPVVIGEFGAREKDGNLQDRVEYSAYYIAYARSIGISCVWWDNHSFEGNGENFGLLNRKTLTFDSQEIVDALMQYAN